MKAKLVWDFPLNLSGWFYPLKGVVMNVLLSLDGTVTCNWKNDKYFHFYAITFGLGCGAALYRPFRSIITPSLIAALFTILFEVGGIMSDLPAQTRKCKGRPYETGDVCWGFGFAVFVAILNLHSYHVYTLSYGCGIIAFALRGVKRKYSSLWELRQGR